MKITAAASRWVSHQRRPRALNSVAARLVPWVRGASIATVPTSTGGGSVPRRRASRRGISLRRMIQGSISTAASRIRPRKAGTAPGRQGGHGLHLHLLVADLERARDRHALAQHLVDQHDQDRTQARAEHPAAPAQDRGAADDHRGDDDQLGAQAVLRGDALVLGDVHQAGQRGAQGGEHEAADAHAVACRCRHTRPPARCRRRRRSRSPSGCGPARSPPTTATSTKTRIWLLKPSALPSPSAKNANSLRLDLVGDGLAAGQAQHQAAADEQHGERGDERRHLEPGDQHAVDQADREAGAEADREPRPRPAGRNGWARRRSRTRPRPGPGSSRPTDRGRG